MAEQTSQSDCTTGPPYALDRTDQRMSEPSGRYGCIDLV